MARPPRGTAPGGGCKQQNPEVTLASRRPGGTNRESDLSKQRLRRRSTGNSRQQSGTLNANTGQHGQDGVTSSGGRRERSAGNASERRACFWGRWGWAWQGAPREGRGAQAAWLTGPRHSAAGARPDWEPSRENQLRNGKGKRKSDFRLCCWWTWKLNSRIKASELKSSQRKKQFWIPRLWKAKLSYQNKRLFALRSIVINVCRINVALKT